MKSGLRIFDAALRVAPPMLLVFACAGEAAAADDPSLPASCDAASAPTHVYRHEVNTTFPSSPAPFIGSLAATRTWSTDPTSAIDATGTAIRGGITITVPLTAGTTQVVTLSAASTPTSLGSGTLDIKATSTDAANPGSCTGHFGFEVTSGGGGWGDPHLTTVDGIHYDFQSAGEFTALRKNGFEVQTRQTPVPTASVPITNAYTGITHCVAIYTAVAAKFGSTRVTLQPSPGAQPDPKSMQLRVNGKLTTLSDKPLLVRAGGGDSGPVDATLTQHRDGNYEFTDARGAQLVVTPGYWDAHQVWYLNVAVYETSAHEGTMGSIAPKSWLPALPDGSSLGAKPAAESDRYQALYEKFADAWRVTDATSLFDYAPGTNTASFTRDEWPRNHPESCAIEGQTSVQGVTEQEAQQACANVTHAAQKADCIFDVKITGHKGFAKSYETMQGFRPRGPGWYTPEPSNPKPPTTCPPQCPTCPACPVPPSAPPAVVVLILLGILQLVLLIVLLIRSKKP